MTEEREKLTKEELMKIDDSLLDIDEEFFKNLDLGDNYKDAVEAKSKAYSGQRQRTKKNNLRKNITNWLVIIHTTVYMLIYYGTSPTSGSYSKALDFPDILTGIVKAATPFAAFISTFFYNFMIDNNIFRHMS